MGRCGNGIIYSFRSKLFNCRDCQHKVLDLFGKLRNGKDPKGRCRFEDFDYGPIEIGVRLHQAEVL